MKNLKFTIFSLFAMLAISVLMTSCGKEDIKPDADNTALIETIEMQTTQEVDQEVLEATFILPFGYSDLSDNEKNDYINALSYEEVLKLAESRKIVKYIESLEKMSLLENQLQHGDIVDEKLMSNILSPTEILAYQEFQIDDQVEVRSCSAWTNVGNQYSLVSCFMWWCSCKVYQNQRRNCSSWCIWCSEFRRKFVRNC